MRKRTIRKGLRLVLAALLLIIFVSYYYAGIADLFALSISAEERFYSLGILSAAAIGGYGVVLTVLGFVLTGDARDTGVRLLPVYLFIAIAITLFFWLLISSLNNTSNPRKLRPNETITI